MARMARMPKWTCGLNLEGDSPLRSAASQVKVSGNAAGPLWPRLRAHLWVRGVVVDAEDVTAPMGLRAAGMPPLLARELIRERRR
jgi:hypothetical protein